MRLPMSRIAGRKPNASVSGPVELRGVLVGATRGSTLLVRVEDVVLRLHGRVARVSAVRGAAGIGRELVGCSIVVEQRVSPFPAFRKSLAVLFHEEGLREDVWHIHNEGGLRAPLELPLELRNHGAIRERLTVARDP